MKQELFTLPEHMSSFVPFLLDVVLSILFELQPQITQLVSLSFCYMIEQKVAIIRLDDSRLCRKPHRSCNG